MHISLSPIRMEGTLKASLQGEKLTVNRRVFDFAPLPEGATLPAEAVDSDFVVGTVTRTGGQVHVTLLLPHGPNPPHEMAFPVDLVDPPDGDLAIPQMPEPPAEEEEA